MRPGTPHRRPVDLHPTGPRRWLVERRFAWLGRCHRLSRGYEHLRINAENVVYLAVAMLFLRRLPRTPRVIRVWRGGAGPGP
ncbi:transposase [Nonomuraea sp. NPDC005983]|uniref:transposase n=1 Tax=Nonomuraea sp. NPDC005983 TaxID=3155595 RepID=UPI0033B52021